MKRSLLLIFLPFIIFAFLSFFIFQKGCDYAMSNQAEKPIPFNHKTHLTQGYGISGCEDCHGYYENGRFTGIPTVGQCRACHEKPIFKDYKDSDVPWESYARQPDLVYFSHIAVLKNRKEARCSSCHGDKQNAVDGRKIKGKMSMGVCMDCHTALKISNKCAVCHD